MSRFWVQLHGFATHPYVQLAVGTATAVAGLWGLASLTEQEVTASRIHGEHGVVALGLFTALLALGRLVEGAELGARGLVETTGDWSGTLLRRAGGLLRTPHAQVFLGILILFAGLAEAAEDLATRAEGGGPAVWHWGLIVVGVSSLSKGLSGIFRALQVVREAETEGGWRFSLVERVDRVLRTPYAEATVALAVLLFGVLEELWSAADASVIEAHHGMLIFGFHYLLSYVPKIFGTVDLVDDSHQAWIGRHSQ